MLASRDASRPHVSPRLIDRQLALAVVSCCCRASYLSRACVSSGVSSFRRGGLSESDSLADGASEWLVRG